MSRFDVDVEGLAELEGGRDPARLVFELVANVFDEFRGYGPDRSKPTRCAVTIQYHRNPRGVRVAVWDDGPGFDHVEDVWTFFGTTEKRDEPGVSGRFNAGEKQLIALARAATVTTRNDDERAFTVSFNDRGRTVTRHRSPRAGRPDRGTEVDALMPWSQSEGEAIRASLAMVIPPEGLRYTVGESAQGAIEIKAPDPVTRVSVTLATQARVEGVLREVQRKGIVEVLTPTLGEPWLYELGLPIVSLAGSGFRWSLNVLQKVPVPMSRDLVSPAYLHRLFGVVVEAAALDGVALLTPDDAEAPHLSRTLEWVRRPEALKPVIDAVYGDDAVRQSNDALANARAVAEGRALVPGRRFSTDTRGRLDRDSLMPTSHEVYGTKSEAEPAVHEIKCPKCGAVIAP